MNEPMDIDGKKEASGPPQAPTTANGSKASTPPPPSPATGAGEASKQAGNRLFKARDYARAIEQYSKAIELEPKNATYLSNRAAAYMSCNKYAKALEDCIEADRYDPNNAKTLLRMGRIQTALGRPDGALLTYSRIDASPKDKAPALQMAQHIKEAEKILERGNGSMALHALERAEEGLGSGVEPPKRWKILRAEANLKLNNESSLSEAQDVAMSLLRQNTQDPDALMLRGRILYARGDNTQASKMFQEALRCDPDYSKARVYLKKAKALEAKKEAGNEAYKKGDFQAAVELYTEALSVDSENKRINAKLYQNRAMAQTKLKQWELALSDCDEALKLDPTYSKARKTRAKALGESGNWEEAVRELKAVLDTSPEDGSVRKELRNAELELKKSRRKDYYKILGVDKNATEQDIKKAYRKMAILHHPDKNLDDPKAAEKFKDIGEAYETLSDPQKKAKYDNPGLDPEDMFEGMGSGGFGGMNGIDPNILFNMMNGGSGGFSFGTGGFGGASAFGGGRGGGGRHRTGQHDFPGGFPF